MDNFLIHSVSDVTTITPRRDVEDHVRISRTQVDEPPLEDWEIGLREAAHQALLREGYADPSVRDYLQSAPFSGKQTVKVFGDIAILARGQLYGTPVGFSFVQDPYHNDCDECHNERKSCRGDKCDHYIPYGAQQLVALWTVKRIRHRDENFGYRYEVEYTISPVDRALKDGLLTKNGKFDYGIPGHVFVIRSNPRYTNGYEHNEFYSSPDQVKWHRQYIPRPPNDFLYPPVLITHSHGPPITDIHHSQPPTHVHEKPASHNNNLKEIQLYRNLINSLSAKTSTTGHRFKISTQNTTPRTTIDKISNVTPTKKAQQTTSSSPQRTTLVQLPTGQIVPLTEATVPEGQLQILTPVEVGTLQTIATDKVHFVPSSPITVTEVTKYTSANIPNQIPSTKVPIFIMKELIPPSSPSVRPEVVKDMGSTKLPKKTTIHFFAAEDVDKSAQEEKDINDIFTINTKKYPTRKQFTKTTSSRTTENYYDENDEDLNLFPAAKPTESMRKVTELPFRDTSPTINQISRPYKETATTQFHSTSSSTQDERTNHNRRTTTNLFTTTTEIPFIYGTQRTTITLPMPSTSGQQTSRETTTGRQTTETQSSTITQPRQTTQYQRSTITEPMRIASDEQTTRGSTYGRETIGIRRTTPIQRSTDRSSTYNYDGSGTPESNEAIITVTPVPTVTFGTNGFGESTARSYEYTQGRLTTYSNNEYTTERREPSTDNALSRTTLIFPSTSVGVSTQTPRQYDATSKETSNYGRTTQTYSDSVPTTETRFNTPIINTIVTYFSPQTTEYSNAAYPSTETVPNQPTTSPITRLTTAIFRSSTPTRITTTKLKPATTKSTSNDFLLEEISDEDNSAPISKNKSKYQDYTDDDIFGPAKPKPKEKKFSSYKQLPKTYKTSFTTEPTRTVVKTPRIIYSDFYEASTVPPTTSLTQFYAESQNNYITQPMDSTTQRLPLTSQSYLTSISYKVNKKKPTISDELEVLPTIKAKLSNLLNEEKLQIFRAELPENEENPPKKSDEQEAFNNIALQLVNHARGLELLNKKPAVENKNALQEKKNLKYRRRSYMPKSRKNLTNKAKNKKDQ